MSANVLRRELALFTEGTEAEGKKRGRRHLEKVVKKSKHASQDETAVDLYKKNNVDHTARNLEYFQHSSSTAKSVSNQVMLQNAGRKAKDRKLKEEKRKEESIFTEQDFKRFQREYFGKH